MVHQRNRRILAQSSRDSSVPQIHYDPSDVVLICLVKRNKICFWIQKSNLGFSQRNAPLFASTTKCPRVHFFGRVRDRIFHSRSRGFVPTTETKNPKMDLFLDNPSMQFACFAVLFLGSVPRSNARIMNPNIRI